MLFNVTLHCRAAKKPVKEPENYTLKDDLRVATTALTKNNRKNCHFLREPMNWSSWKLLVSVLQRIQKIQKLQQLPEGKTQCCSTLLKTLSRLTEEAMQIKPYFSNNGCKSTSDRHVPPALVSLAVLLHTLYTVEIFLLCAHLSSSILGNTREHLHFSDVFRFCPDFCRSRSTADICTHRTQSCLETV